MKKCEREAIELNQKDNLFNLEAGIIIVAAGIQAFDPKNAYGYNRFENVITQLELERIMAPNGPTEGNFRRISDEKVPKKMLMIQCVGSRSLATNEYCSAGICCMVAIKNARILKQHHPSSEIIISYIDIRAPGKDYEEYYKNARDMGIKFVRGSVSQVREDKLTKNLKVILEDTLENKIKELEFDLVVLSVAIQPAPSINKIAKITKLALSNGGFLKEFHSRLDPIGTKMPGIFLSGACQGPKSVDETVMMAKGASSSAATLMIQGIYEIKLIKAKINNEKCVKCGICLEICQFDAIKIKNDKMKVDEIMCRGCGACSSMCKNNAIELPQYRSEQMNTFLDYLFQEI
ncbi:MAG: CoB--CoM heterodisulfide reductase iron-sulfur subunit A family protein [Candidatus Lokiarchaeota archaeon]|nr:CoB--CoM heterodisulfide reductase iron-sulfur subunit A family protein [Candidatus Lokiarchaeota archaeon]